MYCGVAESSLGFCWLAELSRELFRALFLDKSSLRVILLLLFPVDIMTPASLVWCGKLAEFFLDCYYGYG